MRVRRLDANGDVVFGGGLAAFYVDVPDAPALACSMRLSLRQGEWYLDTGDGTPWGTRVLGKFTGDTRDVVLQARALGTPGVTGLLGYASNVNRSTRAFLAQLTLGTVYGPSAPVLQAV